MKRVSFVAVSAALILSACGGSDDSSSPQDQVADMYIEITSEQIEGTPELAEVVTIDEDCVRQTFSRLSDEDAEAIVEAGPDGDLEVSDEAEAIGLEASDCMVVDVED